VAQTEFGRLTDVVALANEFCRAIWLGSGRVALLNCGMVGRLDPCTQQIVLELILAIVSLDAQRCAELTLELALPESPRGSLRALMADVFRQQLLGKAPLPSLLRRALELKNLSLQSSRQLEVLLSRITLRKPNAGT
jgi:predicted unusual protein kinase regulating ubiquinone biosynthesis (AarF/ABC1/UbiB family)